MTRVRPKLTTDLGVLYETDCFNLLAALKPDSLDCIFADPPFNLGKDYGRGPMKDAVKKHGPESARRKCQTPRDTSRPRGADDLPLVLIAIEHDGPGPSLAKQPKR